MDELSMSMARQAFGRHRIYRGERKRQCAHHVGVPVQHIKEAELVSEPSIAPTEPSYA